MSQLDDWQAVELTLLPEKRECRSLQEYSGGKKLYLTLCGYNRKRQWVFLTNGYTSHITCPICLAHPRVRDPGGYR